MAAGAIFNFVKKMLITPDQIEISCTKVGGQMHHCHPEMITRVQGRVQREARQKYLG